MKSYDYFLRGKLCLRIRRKYVLGFRDFVLTCFGDTRHGVYSGQSLTVVLQGCKEHTALVLLLMCREHRHVVLRPAPCAYANQVVTLGFLHCFLIRLQIAASDCKTIKWNYLWKKSTKSELVWPSDPASLKFSSASINVAFCDNCSAG